MTTSTQLRGFELQQALVRKAGELPPISASIVDLTAVCIEADWQISDASEVIDKDPVLLGAIVREANSAVFGSASMIGTSHDAIVRLGAARVMSLAIELGLEGLLGNTSPYGPAAVDVFKHSHLSSVAAEAIRNKARTPLPQIFAAAALMHDLGELVLAHFIEPRALEDLADAIDRGLTQIEAERSLLDLDHCEVSAIICQQWRMPETISHAIEHHHSPWVTNLPVAYGVALADQVATAILLGPTPANVADSLIVSRCMLELEIENTTLDDLVFKTQSRLEKRECATAELQ